MSRHDDVTDGVGATVVKVPLRTYSRRGRLNKRSHSSLPEDLTDSLIETDSNSARLRASQLGIPERKRRRNTTSSGKTLTEVFWEQLSSSAPVYTRALETNQAELDLPIKYEENNVMIGKPSQSNENSNNLPAKHVNQDISSSLGQRPHSVSSELMVPLTARKDSVCLDKADKNEDYPQPRLQEKQGLARTSNTHSKLRKPLNLPLSRSPKTKRARHALDVDESLSLVEARTAKGPLIRNIPMAWSKGNEYQDFRKLDSTKDSKVKHSSDGFEREEARARVFGRRRRLDSTDHNIGSLELTQGGARAQKVGGPTWARAKKKTQVSTTTKPWSKIRHSNSYMFQIDVEEHMEPAQSRQSRQSSSDDQELRGLRKHRISRVISVDDGDGGDEEELDGLMKLAAAELATDGDSRPSGPDINKVKTSRARYGQGILYISDADEPVVLLASPADHENEATYTSDGDESVNLLVPPGQSEDDAALATIPRKDTPEHGADNEEALSQLPPKEWTLHVDYDRDALALRPDSREWTRELEVPHTSPDKQRALQRLSKLC